jgi:hypothetical protein
VYFFFSGVFLLGFHRHKQQITILPSSFWEEFFLKIWWSLTPSPCPLLRVVSVCLFTRDSTHVSFFFFADHHFSMYWFLLLLHSLVAFLLSFFIAFFSAFGDLFLRQELQDHTSFTLKVQQPPFGAVGRSLQVEQHAMDWYWSKWYGDFGDPKKQIVGIYWVATHHKSELGWVPGNSLCRFWGANIVC